MVHLKHDIPLQLDIVHEILPVNATLVHNFHCEVLLTLFRVFCLPTFTAPLYEKNFGEGSLSQQTQYLYVVHLNTAEVFNLRGFIVLSERGG
jgi:hypothetical protein